MNWTKKLIGVMALMFISTMTLAAEIAVYKSATCGCCSKWVRYLEQNGFKVKSHDVQNVYGYKDRHKVPEKLHACHTAVVDGYVIEGHVPAADIERLLRERPAVAGLSVPGMPPGSPGMESTDPVAYEVLSFDKKGEIRVFARH